MIKIENIHLSYNDEIVLNGINCMINKGESICFWGPSGSGKSSLMKIIMGIEVPDSGKIIIDGIELNSESIIEVRKKIIWVPQNINLPVNNSTELLQLLMLDSKQKLKFEEFVFEMGIDKNILDKDFQEISGGQKQRIVIASGLALQKPILLLDEPTSALDAESVDKLIGLILTQLNITVISASHDKNWSKANNQILRLGE